MLRSIEDIGFSTLHLNRHMEFADFVHSLNLWRLRIFQSRTYTAYDASHPYIDLHIYQRILGHCNVLYWKTS
jgi:hypothetical protein